MQRHHLHLHVRITASEYEFLVTMAAAADESVAACVRRLIRAAMPSAPFGMRKKSGTGPVPLAPLPPASVLYGPGQ